MTNDVTTPIWIQPQVTAMSQLQHVERSVIPHVVAAPQMVILAYLQIVALPMEAPLLPLRQATGLIHRGGMPTQGRITFDWLITRNRVTL